jgi:hypothetical protein
VLKRVLRLTPGGPSVTVSCSGATSATLVTPPAHGEVSNVSVDWYGLHFDARPDDGSPRFDEAVFQISGHEATPVLWGGHALTPTGKHHAVQDPRLLEGCVVHAGAKLRLPGLEAVALKKHFIEPRNGLA